MPGIYAQFEEGSICLSAFSIYVHCAVSDKFGVAVFNASILDGGVHLPLVYMCIVLYLLDVPSLV